MNVKNLMVHLPASVLSPCLSRNWFISWFTLIHLYFCLYSFVITPSHISNSLRFLSYVFFFFLLLLIQFVLSLCFLCSTFSSGFLPSCLFDDFWSRIIPSHFIWQLAAWLLPLQHVYTLYLCFMKPCWRNSRQNVRNAAGGFRQLYTVQRKTGISYF